MLTTTCRWSAGRNAWLVPLALAISLVAKGNGLAPAAETFQPTGWRGPRRDGAIAGAALPQKWPTELKRQWSIEIGTGHASPIVAENRLYVFGRVGNQEVLRCLDLAGETLWQQSYDAPYKPNDAAASHGSGPKSTPFVSAQHIYTLGIDGIFQCRRRSDGALVWQAGKELPSGSPLYGAAASPLATSRLCFIHLGKHDAGALCALDAATGKVAWRWAGDGPAYASPVIMVLAGTPQLVTHSQKFAIGLAADGQPLWKVPYTTGYDQNSVTPVQFGDLVIFSGYQTGITAYRPANMSGAWQAEEVWHVDDPSLYMSSPVVVGQRLVAFSEKNSGQLVCLDPATGKTIWRGRPRQGDNAALVVLGDQTVAALFTDGRLLFFHPHADAFSPLVEYRVAETPTWAHPAFAGSQVFIKDERHLTAWTWE